MFLVAFLTCAEVVGRPSSISSVGLRFKRLAAVFLKVILRFGIGYYF
jgi:hypothetical protein